MSSAITSRYFTLSRARSRSRSRSPLVRARVRVRVHASLCAHAVDRGGFRASEYTCTFTGRAYHLPSLNPSLLYHVRTIRRNDRSKRQIESRPRSTPLRLAQARRAVPSCRLRSCMYAITRTYVHACVQPCVAAYPRSCTRTCICVCVPSRLVSFRFVECVRTYNREEGEGGGGSPCR